MTTETPLPVLELLPAVDVADGKAVRLAQGEAGSETSYGDPARGRPRLAAAGRRVDPPGRPRRRVRPRLQRRAPARGHRAGSTSRSSSPAASATTNPSRRRSTSASPASTSAPRHWRTRSGPPRSSSATATRSPSASTCAAPPSPAAAGPRKAGTSGRCSTASRTPAAPATSSPTSPRTARSRARTSSCCARWSSTRGKPVVASGGISSLDDIAALRSLVPLGVEGAIVGKALYNGSVHPGRGPGRRRPPLGGRSVMTHTHDPHDPNNRHETVQAGTGAAPVRHLPGHIAAALAGAGGATDSAGQPWAGRSLSGDDAKIHNFEDDDGTADAGYLAALSDLAAGTGDEAAVVAALATARVFVPILRPARRRGRRAAAGPHGDRTALGQAGRHGPRDAQGAGRADGHAGVHLGGITDGVASGGQAGRRVRGPGGLVSGRGRRRAARAGSRLGTDVRGPPAGGLGPRPAAAMDAVIRRSAISRVHSGTARLAFRRSAVLKFIRGVELPRPRPMAGGSPVGGAGPELRVVLYLEDGLDAAGVQSIVAGLNNAWARNEIFAERVDSIEVKLQRAAP